MQGKMKHKEVKKSIGIRNFYLTIISSIQESGKLPCHKQLNMSKQNLNYYIRTLKIQGIIKKLGYGTWQVNEQKLRGFKQVKKVKKSTAIARNKKVFTSKNIRGHGFVWKLKIPKITNWNKREHYLDMKNIKYKIIGSNWRGQRIDFRKHKTWLTNKSIIVFAPKRKRYFASSSKEARKTALYDIMHLIHGIEKLMGCSFMINKEYKIKFSRQHYADMNNELAKQYDRDKRKLKVADYDGEWLVIDYSMGKVELETLHPKTAHKDMDKFIQPFLNDGRRHVLKTGEPILLSEIVKVCGSITANQLLFDRNFQTHLRVLNKLGRAVDKLAEEVKKKR